MLVPGKGYMRDIKIKYVSQAKKRDILCFNTQIDCLIEGER